MPKAGSSTLIAIIQTLGKRNHFKFELFNKPHQKHFISKKEEDLLKRELQSDPKPLIYIRHLHWIQFHEPQKPIYINVVRDPGNKTLLTVVK